MRSFKEIFYFFRVLDKQGLCVITVCWLSLLDNNGGGYDNLEKYTFFSDTNILDLLGHGLYVFNLSSTTIDGGLIYNYFMAVVLIPYFFACYNQLFFGKFLFLFPIIVFDMCLPRGNNWYYNFKGI